jgi:hypothetical protein
MLSAKEIATVNDVLLDRGISYEPLRIDLIDHLCCFIEEEMDKGVAFNIALHSAVHQFGDLGLETTQEVTLYFLTQNLKKMKVAASITGFVGSILVLIGVLFKTMYWPGASISFVLGGAIIGLTFLPLLLGVKMKEVQTTSQKTGVLVGILAAILFLFGVMFKVMHWPFANILINSSIAICCLIFLPLRFVRAYQQPDNKWFNSAIIISIFAGVLALFMMSNRTESKEMAMEKQTLLASVQQTNQGLKTVNLTADKAALLEAIDRYESKLLSDGSSESQNVYKIDFQTVHWVSNIDILMKKTRTEFENLISIASSSSLEPKLTSQFKKENLEAIHHLPLYDRILALEHLKAQF